TSCTESGRFSTPARVHHGRLSCAGPMAWRMGPTRLVSCLSPLLSCVCNIPTASFNLLACALFCSRLWQRLALGFPMRVYGKDLCIILASLSQRLRRYALLSLRCHAARTSASRTEQSPACHA